ncbi:hypothetical protein [Acrocarpospora catenulata]|uniref:hypothetical protein n=1 Tax=Acrocarpospora catenulata TaxID=2836182 RepID=UPI001BDB5572|nr:hypothetical protein [Acrocarpospora catenulata]
MRRNPFPGTGPDRPRPTAFADYLVPTQGTPAQDPSDQNPADQNPAPEDTPASPAEVLNSPTAPHSPPDPYIADLPLDPYADDPPEAVTGQRPVLGRHARPMPGGVQPWQGWLPDGRIPRPVPPPRRPLSDPPPAQQQDRAARGPVFSAPVADTDIAYELHRKLQSGLPLGLDLGLDERRGSLPPEVLAAVRELRAQTMQLMSALEAAIENEGGVLWPGPARGTQR